MRKVLIAILVLTLGGMAALLAAVRHGDRGYFAPQFTADGARVVVIVREARALVLGLGYEMWTPPARVRVTRDRFSVVRVALADGRVETLLELPASPIEGAWITAYRPGIYGSAHGHLRWATPDHLEYEASVEVPRQPTSETYVARRRWDANTRAWIESAPWTRGSRGLGGDEASQLSGDREVVAVRVGRAMPCAVVIVTAHQQKARPVLETDACRAAHPDGYVVAALADVLRRSDIERVAHLKRTHDELVASARARGLSEGAALREAIRGMQRLGLYPKPSTMAATRIAEPGGITPAFAISDEEFRVGLFSDIRDALDRPGEDVEKSTSPYIIHRDYDTSRLINQYLSDRQDTEFILEADGALWRVVVDYR